MHNSSGKRHVCFPLAESSNDESLVSFTLAEESCGESGKNSSEFFASEELKKSQWLIKVLRCRGLKIL